MLFTPDPSKNINHIDHTVKPLSNKNNSTQTVLSSSRYTYSKKILSDSYEYFSIPVNITYNIAKNIRLTLTPQAIRSNKYDFNRGQFDRGYPFNDVYYFCDQNLTSIYKYGSLHWSRKTEDNLLYPQDTSLYIVDGNNSSDLCDTTNPPVCSIVCPSGSVLDPSSCLCSPPEECIPQIDCTPEPLYQDFKPVIEGYAFYLHNSRPINIPGIGDRNPTCWGGHTCNSTIFKPILVDDNNNIIVANRNISMNNIYFYGGSSGQIPAPGFTRVSPYDRSDTFQFVLNDPSVLTSLSFYLDCTLSRCHNGVTMVFLVGETTTNEKVLLFSSCVVPGSFGKKPIGTIDCDTESSAVPCEPPPPPSSVYCFEKTISMYDGFKDCIIRTCAAQSPIGETGWTQVGGPYIGSCPDCADDPCDPPYYCFSKIDQPNCPDQDCVVRQCATSTPSGDGWTQDSGPYATIGECESSCSDDPCDPPAPVYCFEQGGDCVTRTCSETDPGEGWEQVGGPYECGTCEECDNIGNCPNYNVWRITDQDNYIYGSGIISYDNTFGYLNDLPNPFTPLFYGTVGSKNFDLQVLCDGETWDTIDEWDGTIVLCSGVNDRYPAHPFNSGYGWVPQGECAVRVNENGDAVCEPQPCLNLMTGSNGDGQAWRDPQPSGAYKFVGTTDTEWTNLNNWEDSSGLSPASALPANGDNVLIAGNVSKIPNDYFSSNSIVLNNVTINTSGTLGVSLSCANLLCDGGRVFAGDSCSSPIQIQASETCEFINGGFLQDADITISASPVKFRTGSNVDRSTITGNAEFYDNSSATEGTVTGNVIFYDTSSMGSNFIFNGSGDFYNTSTRQSSTMYFSHSTVTFHDSSKNYGYMEHALFTDSSINETTGSVATDATFSDTSKNRGNVGGTATFTDSACNDGGTAGTFVPNPPPSC
jgi:hypothetical protein